jgi:protein subunit release factor B
MVESSVGRTKTEAVLSEMKRLGLFEADIVERFILGSGPGGQKINKTSSCVHLRHEPTGIEVKCRRSRSRALNRFLARRELCEKVKESRDGETSRRMDEIEKERRRKRRRSQRQKQRMLEGKHRKAEKKRLRRPPGIGE